MTHMTQWYVALPITVLIILISAFFVIIEFSLLAARRNRLEESAETSASSRAALRSLNELTIMLAGAQLGITAATFALGAITKPWVHHLLEPAFVALRLPGGITDTLAFLLSLFLVTFLHLVVGEMAPKSWAIAHPESAIKLIARPARAFITVFRPLLLWINQVANRLVRKAGKTPVDRAAARGYDAEMLSLLVEHSKSSGLLDTSSAEQISNVIALETATLSDALRTRELLPLHASVAQVHERAGASGNLRILLGSPSTPQLVHVRDTLLAAPNSPASAYSRPALQLPASLTMAQALKEMRAHGEQIAVIYPEQNSGATRPDGVVGVVTWEDVLSYLWPSIQQELGRVNQRRHPG